MTEMSPPDSAGDPEFDEYVSALSQALHFVVQEPVAIARLRDYFDPKPASLAETEADEAELSALEDRVVPLYGGVPRLIVQGVNEPPPTFDTYFSAALDEAIEAFRRARRSLCRAQLYLVGTHLLETNPEVLEVPPDHKFAKLLQSSAEEVFWEHTETTFIRLAGFWDRLGQILDFAFFNIRRFERDGFTAVVDRIRLNTLRLRPDLERSAQWRAIWDYKKSEKEDGLQWLLSRRNMLVHSLHLRPAPGPAEEEIFRSTFNHLESRLIEDLRPAERSVEIRRLSTHLEKAARLTKSVLELCEINARES